MFAMVVMLAMFRMDVIVDVFAIFDVVAIALFI